MQDKILILDFGSQYTQLIGRKIRELNVYCEIHPYNHFPAIDDTVKGVVLSGSPFSVRDANAPRLELNGIKDNCRFWVFAMVHNIWLTFMVAK
jgi:GMP synthase (glutamine-hydrolysing)